MDRASAQVWWAPDGPVNDIVVDSAHQRVILGGAFTVTGPQAGNLVGVHRTDGTRSMQLPMTNGTVKVIIDDGNGGWFIGGTFTQVDGQPRSLLARVDQTGALTPFIANVTGSAGANVDQLLLRGDTLFIGGAFNHVGSTSRFALAAVNANTGSVLAWPSGASAAVKSLHMKGDSLILVSNNSVEFLRPGQQVLPIIPNQTTGYYECSALSGDTLFIGGSFNRIGTSAAFGAVLDPVTWSPAEGAFADAPIRISIPDGSSGWFIAGDFSMVRGTPRSKLARVRSDGTLHPWTPSAPIMAAHALSLSAGRLFVGATSPLGARTIIALDTLTGVVLPTFQALNLNGPLASIASDDSIVFVGGSFDYIGPTIGSPCITDLSDTGSTAIALSLGAITEAKPDSLGWVIRGNGISFLDANGQALVSSGPIPGNVGLVVGTDSVDCFGNGPIRISRASGGVLLVNNKLAVTGTVTDMERIGDSLIIAGSFTQVSEFRSFGVPMDPVSKQLFHSSPVPNGIVRLAVEDGEGGWIISGDFTQIGAAQRTRLARIAQDGSLADLALAVNGTITAMHRSGDTLFIGGAFTTVGGSFHLRFAAIRLSTMSVLSGYILPYLLQVKSITSSSSHVLVGTEQGLFSFDRSIVNAWYTIISPGNFTALVTADGYLYAGGSGLPTAAYLMRFSLTTLDIDTTALFAPGPISALKVTPQFIWASRSIAGSHPFGMLRTDVSTGVVATGISGSVQGMEFINERLLLTGTLSVLGTSKIAAYIDPASGNVLQDDLAGDGAPLAVCASANRLYMGGNFSRIGGGYRNGLAALDRQSGSLLPWDPDGTGNVRSMLLTNDRLYVNGFETGLPGNGLTELAVLDLSTGQFNTWAPPISTTLAGPMAVGGDTLYCALWLGTSNGNTSVVDGVIAVDRYTGDLMGQPITITKAPSIGEEQTVRVLEVHGNQLLIGGRFHGVNGTIRTNCASVDRQTGAVLPWHRHTNGEVRCISTSGSQRIIAGVFTSIGGDHRTGVAALDAGTGALLPWSADLDAAAQVKDVVLSGTEIFLSGKIGSVKGQPRDNLVKLDRATAGLAPWHPVVPPQSGGLLVDNDDVYAVGGPNGIVRVNASTGNPMPWPMDTITFGILDLARIGNSILAAGSEVVLLDRSSGASSSVVDGPLDQPALTAVVSGSNLFLGGQFQQFGLEHRTNVAAISLASAEVLPFAPNISSSVRTMAVNGQNVLIGGYFSSVNGTSCTGFSSVDRSSSLLAPFIPQVFYPHGLRVDADTLYAWGTAGPSTPGGCVKLSTTTGALYDWSPATNGTIATVLPTNGQVLVGGAFNIAGGRLTRGVAVLDILSGEAIPYPAAIDGTVNALAIDQGRLIIGGGLNMINGSQRNHLGAVDLYSGALDPWAPALNSAVNDLAVRAGSVLAGGTFSDVNGAPRQGLALFVPGGALSPFAPTLSAAAVNAVELTSSHIYAGGDFTSLLADGSASHLLAGWDRSTLEPLPWYSGPEQPPQVLLQHGGRLWVGGYFGTIGGATANGLASLDAVTGNLLDAEAFGTCEYNIMDLAVSGPTLHFGGQTITTPGTTCGNRSALDLEQAWPVEWTLGTNGQVRAIAVHGANVFIGGQFTQVNGSPRLNFEVLGGCTPNTFHVDADGDGHGAPAIYTSCANLLNAVQSGDDCNDTDASVFPGAICDDGSTNTLDDHYDPACVCTGTLAATITIHLALQGCMTAGSSLMSDGLRSSGLVPVTEPYTAMGFNHVGSSSGTTTTSNILGQSGQSAVVDWVFIELRPASAPGSVARTLCGLLRRSGQVTNAISNSTSLAVQVQSGSYFIVVKHRNHLPICSAAPIELTSTTNSAFIDLSSSASACYGSGPTVLVGSKWCAWAGDVYGDGSLKYTGANNDRDPILVAIGGTTPNNTISGYRSEDVNMDGVVKYTGAGNDRDPILVNVGGTTPNSVRNAQLP